MKGLIHIYTGNGKGKSTAAAGLAIRFAGMGGKVVFAQFMKTNKTSEFKVMQEVDNIDFYLPDRSFGFSFKMTEEKKAEAAAYYPGYLKAAFDHAVAAKAGLLVLDEVINADRKGFLDHEALVQLLKDKPEDMEVVMTGRKPAEDLVALSDYVSSIEMVKHPYTEGVPARKGIEF
ncbi:MAG: cob(I)yrinic acid a,c-diamide adenosyltransferase [Lachnospiraceae bacterium]|nr:cob(I)yrinic acid a,c-diamide adenosyltransferase [Lachnospiraceae bacterium]